jgi:hypothetical protein
VQPLASELLRRQAQALHLRVLSLYEPSPVFRETSAGFDRSPTSENIFIFRVPEAVPAHAPDKQEVAEQVLADARLVEAYKLAQQDAGNFVTQAQARKQRLYAAAAVAKKPIITTGVFGPRSSTIDNYVLPPGESVNLFINAAYNLLARGGPGEVNPMGVVDVKPIATALAAEVNQIVPSWTAETLPSQQLFRSASEEQEAGTELRLRWFDFNEVVQRTHWRSDDGSRRSNTPQNQPPINPLSAVMP